MVISSPRTWGQNRACEPWHGCSRGYFVGCRDIKQHGNIIDRLHGCWTSESEERWAASRTNPVSQQADDSAEPLAFPVNNDVELDLLNVTSVERHTEADDGDNLSPQK